MPKPPAPRGGHNKDPGNLFASEAELYDRFRPTYPDYLFTFLASEVGLTPDSRLLEIGSGTGQATVPMAARGYQLTALEPGLELAEIAREKMAAYPNVEIITDKFENVSLPEESFDLVYAATSFHWVDESVRFTKSYKILKPSGLLAIIRNELVALEQDASFYDAMKPIIERYDLLPVLAVPALRGSHSPSIATTRSLLPEAINEQLFEPVSFFKAHPPITHVFETADDYTAYLRTISAVISLPEAQRQNFLNEIRILLENKFDNRITTHFCATLQLARKR